MSDVYELPLPEFEDSQSSSVLPMLAALFQLSSIPEPNDDELSANDGVLKLSSVW